MSLSKCPCASTRLNLCLCNLCILIKYVLLDIKITWYLYYWYLFTWSVEIIELAAHLIVQHERKENALCTLNVTNAIYNRFYFWNVMHYRVKQDIQCRVHPFFENNDINWMLRLKVNFTQDNRASKCLYQICHYLLFLP